MRDQDLEQRRREAGPRSTAAVRDFHADRGENATLWSAEGRAYTDFACGTTVLNTGHGHPRVMKAIADQLQRSTHPGYQGVPCEGLAALAERVNAMVPIQGPKRTAFFTTAEAAVENALAIARIATGRSGIVAFHGVSDGDSPATHSGRLLECQQSSDALASEVYRVPFPDPLRGITVQDSLTALARLFRCTIRPSRIAAVIIDPVQGEGSYNVVPRDLLRALRRLCDEHGILLIADEIQTGFGRTGALFAMGGYGIEPDLMTMAGSLAGGLPLSAVSGRAALLDALEPNAAAGTHAPSPMAIAAAHAVLDVLHDEGLCARSERLGARLTEFLQDQQAYRHEIAEVRGMGSMVAVEFCDPITRRPSPGIARRVQQAAQRLGLLLHVGGSGGNVMRFLYPLTIPDAQFDDALRILGRALCEASRIPAAA